MEDRAFVVTAARWETAAIGEMFLTQQSPIPGLLSVWDRLSGTHRRDSMTGGGLRWLGLFEVSAAQSLRPMAMLGCLLSENRQFFSSLIPMVGISRGYRCRRPPWQVFKALFHSERKRYA